MVIGVVIVTGGIVFSHESAYACCTRPAVGDEK